MEREGIKKSDLYDWEKTPTDLSTATTTTSTAALQYHSTPENKMAKSDANTQSSRDKHEKKHEHVLQQNKLNKVEGIASYFALPLVLCSCTPKLNLKYFLSLKTATSK